MEIEIIAALIGGIFAITAAIIPLLIKRKREKKEINNTDKYPVADGLSAVVGIVQKGNEVLLVQRKDRLLNLSWQFPAGVVKPAQDMRDKVESEIFQETGIICKARRYLGARVPKTKVLCHYVHCIYIEGEVKNLDTAENSQVVWVKANAVRQLVTSDIYVEVQRLLDEIAINERLTKIVLGIVIQNHKVLLVKKKISDVETYWQFPGGFIEEKESEKKAVEREVFEETGIRCIPIKKIGERKHPKTEAIIAYWLCKYKTGEIEIKEAEMFTDIA